MKKRYQINITCEYHVDVTEVYEKDHKALYRIMIQDTGVGMSEEFIPHLFEPFARERTSTESKVLGTGLGMPIIKALVELMDGTISVESKVGCGTKITVELLFEIAVTLLEESGLLVDHAEDGKMCIEMLHQKEAGYYAAILMDIQMPQMDGYQAARAIRKADDAYASIPIIAMTANAFEEDRKLALESGMSAYIAKPIRMEIVLDVLKQWI